MKGMDPSRVTPMMRQYLEIKERHQDAILFFRLGDFYEMFFEDAEKAAKILEITLTSRNRSEDTPVPLCGVPHHAASPYIGKLLGAGLKVAICEQIEDPKAAKGVVKREVVKVISPGTIIESDALDATDNNFLVAVAPRGLEYGLALTDVSTGEFRCTQVQGYPALGHELGRIRPREVVIPAQPEGLIASVERDCPSVHVTIGQSRWFAGSAMRRLEATEILGASEADWQLGLQAAAVILGYLEDTSPGVVGVLRRLECYRASQYLMIDEMTRENLELLANFRGEKQGTLLSVLDATQTAMGVRELRKWLLYPLLDERHIRDRQDAVEELLNDYSLRADLRRTLGGIQDLERLAGRVASRTITPRDLFAIRESLGHLAVIRQSLGNCQSAMLQTLREQLHSGADIIDLVDKAIVDEPPASLRSGGAIRGGFNSELDELLSIRDDAKGWIARLQEQERVRTGISSLKVRYNKVFGYYIEISNSNLKNVPADYIRKQTLVNGERYITPDLKDYEVRVLGAGEEIQKLEDSIFADVVDKIAVHYDQLKASSMGLARLDTLASLAEVASSRHLSRPVVDSGVELTIDEGRHPVVEAVLGRGAFVPNDCHMDPEESQVLLLTGPNMAGKSTYMRQVALIVILAQMGSFVPAAAAHIGLVDRLFTRFGANDALAKGESTFMVEMKETARILQLATPRSLILLDEVGRGTSTFDGISIAWSLAEYLHDSPHRPRTLFATHYHELTNLSISKERVRNFNFSVKEWQGDVIFLRTLKEGAASRSYGIQVASLAGLPDELLSRAKAILQNLEGEELNQWGRPRLAGDVDSQNESQLMLFSPQDSRLREELRAVDTSVLTPVEALNVLDRLVGEAKKGQ